MSTTVERLRGERLGGRFARMERGTSFIGVGGSKANCLVPQPQCHKSPITNHRDFATSQMLAQARVSAQF